LIAIPGESGNPALLPLLSWIPAFAGDGEESRSWTFFIFLYIAVQHEALSTSGVIGSSLRRHPGPRLDPLLSISRGAL
jgi:hypothetical protein